MNYCNQECEIQHSYNHNMPTSSRLENVILFLVNGMIFEKKLLTTKCVQFDFNETAIFKNTNFRKIHPVGAKLFHLD